VVPSSVHRWLTRASGVCLQRTVASSLLHREVTLDIPKTVLFERLIAVGKGKIATLMVCLRIRALRQRGYRGGSRTVLELSGSATARIL